MSNATHILRRIVRPTVRSCYTVLVALGLSLTQATLHAGDAGQLRDISPENKAWINALTDEYGICCGGRAGALRARAVNWNTAASSYRVKVGDQWHLVPDEAVLKHFNPLGDAVVWLEYEGDIFSGELTPLVRCFLPGSGD